MKNRVRIVGLFACLALSATSYAQPGITAISFSDTAMSPLGSWAVVPLPGYWNIGAILTDASHHPIGSLSPLTTLYTSSAASYPIGFKVTLGENAPADAIVVVYRSTHPFAAGDTVERAEYGGLCLPLGCPAGDLVVPITGELPNRDFVASGAAMPVTLQKFSVD